MKPSNPSRVWSWISVLTMLSPLVLCHVVFDALYYGTLVSIVALPLAVLLCLMISLTCNDRGAMRWPACAALLTAATWSMMLMYSLPLVAFTIAALSLRPTSHRPWVLAGLGLVLQGGCVLMLVVLDMSFRHLDSWLALAQALAVWLPAVGISRAHAHDPEACTP